MADIEIVDCPECGYHVGVYAAPEGVEQWTRESLRVSLLAVVHRMECGPEDVRLRAEAFAFRSIMADMCGQN